MRFLLNRWFVLALLLCLLGTFRSVDAASAPTEPKPASGLTVGSQNLENFFPYSPGDKRSKHNKSIPRSQREWDQRVQKAAEGIEKLGLPDVLALQEVGTTPDGKQIKATTDLAQAILKKTGVQYQAITLPGATDRRGQGTAYLVRFRHENVRLVEAPELLNEELSKPARRRFHRRRLFQRPVFKLTVEVPLDGKWQPVTLFNFHAKAFAGYGKLRKVQLAFIAREMDKIKAAHPDRTVYALGDANVAFNSASEKDRQQWASWRKAGLKRPIQSQLPKAKQHTYEYKGKKALLDVHGIKGHLANRVKQVKIVKTESDHRGVAIKFDDAKKVRKVAMNRRGRSTRQ